ncbi:MAG: ABC-F family ATP-binding cassette domain-containing protein [Lachnospiraceae bacterium]|nr:ABC-F family ATP-binding cassette domain-containing protein [Lachnospiraceae bacterium]
MILDVQNITKAFGEDLLFRDVSFHIEDHEKVALVGINGAGKSTLLKIILNEMDADAGQVVLTRDRSFGYLSQHPNIEGDLTVMEELLTVKEDILKLEQDMRDSEHAMKTLTGEALEEEMARYARMTERFERGGGYALKSEAVGVLKGLGFDPVDFDKPVNVLSGGQKTRLAMGRLLLSAPDLLLLDEPTNHLDLKAIVWLETYLLNYKGAVLVVSHDRYFLNKVVTKVVELDNKRCHVFRGTFDDYNTKKAALLKEAYRAYMKSERERAHQEAVIAKLESFNREKSISRAESRKKVLEKMDVVEKPFSDVSDMRLKLSPRFESGNDVLRIEGLSKAYGEQVLFRDVNIEAFKGERLALIGANGTGKSTLLKILNNIVPMDEGTIWFGSKVTVGYYDQEMQELDHSKTIFQEISDAFPTLNNTEIRSTLAAFQFIGEDVFRVIGCLSGGERARISLAKLMLSEANFLILDEPTNHLDIQSKEILENALTDYTGTVLTVSHDRYFINRIATRVLELEDESILSYPGNYDDHLVTKERLAEAKAAAEAQAPGKTGASGNGAASAAASESSGKNDWMNRKAEEARKRKIANDLAKVENRIAALEEEDAAIDEQFNDPAVAVDVAKLTELSKRKTAIAEELETLFEQWEALSEES